MKPKIIAANWEKGSNSEIDRSYAIVRENDFVIYNNLADAREALKQV